jgi:calcineurin-like phosphoesterase family protein
MNRDIVQKWNEVVGPQDTVYQLGDFCHGESVDSAVEVVKQLNGRIFWTPGNHNKIDQELVNRKLLIDIGREYELWVQDRDIDRGRVMIVLSHYAHVVWNKSHKGSWHLHGHTHGSLPDNPHAMSMDVGCMMHNMYPVSFNDVWRFMRSKDYRTPLIGARKDRGYSAHHPRTNRPARREAEGFDHGSQSK